MTGDSAQVPLLTLNNGVHLPALDFGVFQTPPDETLAAVETALTSPEQVTRETSGPPIPEA